MDKVILEFNNLADFIAKGINDKFIKMRDFCKDLDPTIGYDAEFYNKEDELIYRVPLYYNKHWYIEYGYEDYCCYNELPSADPKDSIVGMTVNEIARFASITYFRVVDDDYKEIFRNTL